MEIQLLSKLHYITKIALLCKHKYNNYVNQITLMEICEQNNITFKLIE